ncbi:hypothetical protein NUSPORA_02216 [Nucleospora cyclopteri]
MLERIIECCGVFTDKLTIKDDLYTLKGMLLKIKRIPTIIDLEKRYENFNVEIAGEANSSCKRVILLQKKGMMFSKRYKVHNVKINLNFNYFTHTELLSEILPKDAELAAFETVGDIIHLNLSEKQLPYKKEIGEILYKKTKKTVVNKVGKIDNEFRNYNLEILAPIKSQEESNTGHLNTIHSENGIKIFIDLKNVYWSSRLQEERRKLINKIQTGTIICDPFCGSGPIVLPLLKKNCNVFANDLNSRAIDCLKKSIKINKLVNKKYQISCEDASIFMKKIADQNIPVDHFIFNLPEFSIDYIQCLKLFKNNFLLHCYFFVRFPSQNYDEIKVVTKYLNSKLNINVPQKCIYFVRDVSPTKSVYKLEIEKRDLN